MTGVIYARVSTEEQIAGQGNALERQISACYACAAKNGYEVENIFKDSASDDRIALQALIKHATENKGSISVVLVASVDRIARSLPEFVELCDMFHGLGIELTSAMAPTNNTAESRFIKDIMATVHLYSRTLRSEHIRAEIRRKRNLLK